MENKLKFRSKLAFGLGDFGGGFCFQFLTAFALIYFTDVAGANVALVSTLLMIAKFFDGITDVIMGHLIDHTRSKMGKARPWMFWSTFPLAIALIMLFNVPETLPGYGKEIYIFVVYLLITAFFYTASNIAYNSLTALMTDNAEDRVGMGSVRFMFTAVAGIIIGTLTTVLIQAFGTGQRGWTAVSILYASIFLITTLISVLGVRELKQTASPDKKEQTGVSFVKSVKHMLSNRYFLLILFVFVMLYIFTGASGVSGIYYATWVLGNANLYGLLSIAMMIPMFLSLIFAPKLVDKLGMKKAAIFSSLLFTIGSLLTAFGKDSIIVLLAGVIIRSLGMGPLSTLVFAFIAEVAENIRLKSNIAIEGMTFSASSVGIKVGSGLGTAVVGWLLAFGHYDGTQAAQTPEALNMIVVSYAVLPLVIGLAVLVLFTFLNVESDNKKLRDSL